MFKKYSSIITFFVTFSLSFNTLPGFSTFGYDNTPETTLEVKKDVCVASLHTLQKNLFIVLDKLYFHLEYWQKAQYRPIGYFIEKGPYRWLFGKNQKTEIRNAIELINHEIIRNTYYLGYLHELEIYLEKTSAHNLEEEIRAIAYKIKPILQLVEIEDLSNGTMRTSKKDLETLLAKNQIMAKSYTKRALRLLKSAQIPGHFQRHWLGYSISSICALIGLNYYCKNKNQIRQWTQDGKVASKNFYTDYIKTPIKNSLDIIYRKKEDSTAINDMIDAISITPEDIENEKEAQRKMIIDYLKDKQNAQKTMRKFWMRIPEKELPKETYDAINKMVKTNTPSKELQDEYVEQAKQPIKNSISPTGQYIRLFNITKVQPNIIRTNEIFLIAKYFVPIIDQLIKANELNFQILVALPAIGALGLIGYLSYKGINGIYQSKKELAFKPIKQALITIETILNTFINEIPSYAVNGQLLYWHNKLYRAVPVIPFASQAKFERDISELISPHFDIPQKLNTVQRMFRAYEFLS